MHDYEAASVIYVSVPHGVELNNGVMSSMSKQIEFQRMSFSFVYFSEGKGFPIRGRVMIFRRDLTYFPERKKDINMKAKCARSIWEPQGTIPDLF